MANAVYHQELAEVPPYWRVDVSRAGVILDNPLAVDLHHLGTFCKGPELRGGTQEGPPTAGAHGVLVPLESSTNSSCVSLDSLQDAAAPPAFALDALQPCDPEHLHNCSDPYRSLDKQTFLRLKLQQLQARQVLQQESLRLQHNEQMGRLREEQHRILSLVALPQRVLDQDAISVDHCSERSQPGPTEFIPIAGCQKEDKFTTEPPPVPGAETVPIMSALPPPRPLTLKETLNPDNASKEWPPISALCEESADSGLKKSFDGEEYSKVEKRTDGGNVQMTSSSDLEDRPIRSGLGGRRTFEQLLDEKLKFEEEQHQITNYSGVKRVFLRKGEGVACFGKNKENIPLGQNLARGVRSNSDGGIEIAVDSRSAVEHRPFKQRSKLCGLQTQYVSKSLQSVATRPKTKPLLKKKNNVSVLSNKYTAHKDYPSGLKGTLGDTQGKRSEFKLISSNQPCDSRKEKRVPLMDRPVEDNRSLDFDAVKIVEQVDVDPNRTDHHSDPKGLDRLSECSFELSFQQKIARWDSDLKRDAHELSEFELLEAKAALDASLHSNASFLLHRSEKCEGSEPLRRNSSTPLQTTPQHMQEIGKSVKQKDCGLGGNRHYAEAVTNDVWTKNIPVHGEKGKPGGCVTMVLPGLIDGKSDSKKADVNVNQCDLKPEGEQKEGYSFLYENGGVSNHNDAIVSSSDDDTTEDRFSDVSGVVEQDPGSEDAPDFDDDHTWLDDCQSEHNDDCDYDDEDTLVEKVSGGTSPAMGKPLARKVASVRKSQNLAESVSASALSQRCSPPTSQLIAKLFPALRPKLKPTIILEKQQSESETIAVPEDAVQSRLLHERLAQLEVEITRFRTENFTLARLRQERESAVAVVHKEMEEFERHKNEEFVKLEELKKEEMRKMRKERRVFEKHAAAARAIPDKQERDKMQALCKELAEVREEMQRREARSAMAQARLRDQVYTVTKENRELREELRRAEQLRLTARSNAAWTGRPRGGPKAPKGSLVVPLSQAIIRSASAPRASSRRSCSPVSLQPKLDVECKTTLSTSVSEDTPRISLIGVPDQCIVMPEAAGNHSAEENAPSLEGIPVGRISDSQDDLVKDRIQYPDGKLELVMQSGRHVITFPNGTRKEISADAKSVLVTFFNGDVKQVFPDQRVVYYYAEAQTTQTTYPDGLEILQFPNKQMEKHYPDGTTEIVFPDETIKYLHPDGNEESIFPDGTIIRLQQNGDKVIEFDNGQREVHTTEFKRREYPDGTTKTVFADGRQETNYSSGRVRIKDCDGNVIFDDHA
uniref:centromere protein J isoform X2 n=1 Tax=Myxine glutinosa TaxID=7769 RepID=UPI00358F513C